MRRRQPLGSSWSQVLKSPRTFPALLRWRRTSSDYWTFTAFEEVAFRWLAVGAPFSPATQIGLFAGPIQHTSALAIACLWVFA